MSPALPSPHCFPVYLNLTWEDMYTQAGTRVRHTHRFAVSILNTQNGMPICLKNHGEGSGFTLSLPGKMFWDKIKDSTIEVAKTPGARWMTL